MTRVGILLLVAMIGRFSEVFAWGDDHRKITQRAMELLPEEDRAMFGTELTNMPKNSTLPDYTYGRLPDGRERFVWGRWGGKVPDTQARPFVNSHIMFTNAENLDTLLWYVTNSVNAMKTKDFDSLGGYAGCLAHVLEDWTTPAHATVDDNMMNFLRTLLPPPAGSRFHDSKMHSRLEGGGFKMDDVTYGPHVLAATPEELAYQLLIRAQAGQLVARAQLVPILQAVYADDGKAAAAAQKPGAVEGLRLVADAYRTIVAIARGEAKREAGGVPIFECWPDETPGLYYPQSLYAYNPIWKPVLERYYREGKHEPEPDAWFFSPGESRRISWTIPPNTFKRFTCRLAHHADRISTRPIKMRIFENGVGRHVATLPVEGTEISIVADLAPATTNLSFSFLCGKAARRETPCRIWPIVRNPRLD